ERGCKGNRQPRKLRVGKSRSSRSESLDRPWESAFVEIDQVGDCENVGAIGDAVVLFPFLQHGSERIAPPKFRQKSIQDKQVSLIRLPASLKAPFEDFLVSSTLEDAFAKIVLVDAQKIAASAIKRSRRTEIFVIIIVQLAARVEANLLQHSREIHHPARHLFRACWIGTHAAVNRIRTISAIFPLENSAWQLERLNTARRLQLRMRSTGVARTIQRHRNQFMYTRSTNQKLPRSTTAAEHAGAQRAINIGFSRSFQMTGSAAVATMI